MGATETGFVPKASERRNRDLRVGFQLFPIRPGQALGFVPEAAPDTLGSPVSCARPAARPPLSLEGPSVGSVIKKRRKRMAKKKHRKLLKKTRIQRRRQGK